MIEKDTIKGLECCLDEKIEKCDECPYCVDTIMCKRRELLEDTFELINYKQELLEAAIAGQETLQKALAKKEREVERLNKEVDRLSQCVLYHDGHIEDAKSEAIEEFASGIKEILGSLFFAYYPDVGEAIDHLENKLKDNDGRHREN